MELNDVDLQETLSELSQRANAEEDFDKLLELAKEIQRRLEARRSRLGITLALSPTLPRVN